MHKFLCKEQFLFCGHQNAAESHVHLRPEFVLDIFVFFPSAGVKASRVPAPAESCLVCMLPFKIHWAIKVFWLNHCFSISPFSSTRCPSMSYPAQAWSRREGRGCLTPSPCVLWEAESVCKTASQLPFFHSFEAWDLPREGPEESRD